MALFFNSVDIGLEVHKNFIKLKAKRDMVLGNMTYRHNSFECDTFEIASILELRFIYNQVVTIRHAPFSHLGDIQLATSC